MSFDPALIARLGNSLQRTLKSGPQDERQWWGNVTAVNTVTPSVTVEPNGNPDTIVCLMSGAYAANTPTVGDVVYGLKDDEGDWWVLDKIATEIGGGGGSGVSSFNTRTGAVTLSKADVTGTGLTYSDVGADASGAAATAQSNAEAASVPVADKGLILAGPTDTTLADLFAKLVAGSNVTITQTGTSTDQTVSISASGGGTSRSFSYFAG